MRRRKPIERRRASSLDRQILIPCPTSTLSSSPSSNLQPPREHRSDHRNIIRKARNRRKEFSKEHKDTVSFDQKTDKRPAEEDQQETADERECSAPFLTAGEEEKCAMRAEEEGYASQEENLRSRQSVLAAEHAW